MRHVWTAKFGAAASFGLMPVTATFLSCHALPLSPPPRHSCKTATHVFERERERERERGGGGERERERERERGKSERQQKIVWGFGEGPDPGTLARTGIILILPFADPGPRGT